MNSDQNVNEQIILLILNSKRLLSDDIDTLELSLTDIKDLSVDDQCNGFFKIFLIGTSIISLDLFQKCSPFRFWVAPTFIGSATCVLWELMKRMHRSTVMNNLNELLQVFNNFDSSIRRNITFFHDVSIFKQHLAHSLDGSINENLLTQTTITHIIQLTKLLGTHIKQLEQLPLPDKFNYVYVPLENLDECQLFQKPINEFESKNVKEFYNIFLFIQSQFLALIGLSTAYNSELSLTFIKSDIPKIVEFVRNQLENDAALHESLTNNRTIEVKAKIFRSQSGAMEPLSILRGCSLTLTSKILAVADGCRQIDSAIQDIAANSNGDIEPKTRKILENLQPALKLLEDSISVCQDDYQRLLLAYCKFVYLRGESLPKEEETATDKMLENQEYVIPVEVIKNNWEEESKEYFAQLDLSKIDDDEDDKKITEKVEYTLDDELQNLMSKTTRKKFKPVLRQLKDRINPIKKSMKTREENYLLSKGLPVDEVKESDSEKGESAESNIDDEDLIADNVNIKCNKKDKYGEMRQLLETKKQINFMQLPFENPILNEGSGIVEDILE